MKYSKNLLIIAVQLKIIKGGFTQNFNKNHKARLLLMLSRPRRVAPPLEFLNEFMN